MSNLVEFAFEGNVVRVELDKGGEPLFNVNDVCRVLGFGNPRQAVASHVDDEDVRKLDTLSEGGLQQANYLTESGLYAIIFGCKLPAAKKFKRWVTSEVLPSIRKTGHYGVPIHHVPLSAESGKVQAALMIRDWLVSVPGAHAGLVDAATLRMMEDWIGVPTEQYRLCLPPVDNVPWTHNPTKLGKLVGLTAKAMNMALLEAGLQVQGEHEPWELTPEGEEWAKAYPYNRNGHSGFQILWNPDVLEHLTKREVLK